eukprot:TRINITY_DN66_c0_g1_i1.p1 TRINITY_DN66_c0_g1~~TRINITY_DN66_c0_g1_i1.p1  ORF type:complete len:297 (-),score=100.81 TRINITY_DN66_c0_g1_i1:90-980(-)
MQVFVHGLAGRLISLNFESSSIDVLSVKRKISELEGLPLVEQRLTRKAKELSDSSVLFADDEQLIPLRLSLRVFGGKGGFGSLLRGGPQGVTLKKTTNFDACRDLNGRRIRHVNNEKELAKWVEDEKERDLEKKALQHIREKEIEAKVEATKQTFQEIRQIGEEFAESLEKGLQKDKELREKRKREQEEEERRKLKTRKTTFDEIDELLFEGLSGLDEELDETASYTSTSTTSTTTSTTSSTSDSTKKEKKKTKKKKTTGKEKPQKGEKEKEKQKEKEKAEKEEKEKVENKEKEAN